MKIKRLATTIMIFLLICSLALCSCANYKNSGGVSSEFSYDESSLPETSIFSEPNLSNSSQLNTSSQQQNVEKTLKRPEKTVFVQDLHASLSSLDIKGENPQIKITWHTYSEKEIEVTKNFDVLYFNGDKYVSCAKKDIEFLGDTFSLHYHEGGRCSNSEEVVYSLKDFDISKEGKYRFVLPMGEKEYIEFNVTKAPVYNNIEFESQIFRIGYADGNKRKEIEALSYKNKSGSTPIIRVQNRNDLITFAEKVALLVYGIRDGVYSEQFQNMFNIYDETFFENHRLYIMYVWAGSGSIKHTVTGVEENGSALDITITREYPQVGTADMAGYALTVSLKKEDAVKYDYFNIKYFDKGRLNTVVID